MEETTKIWLDHNPHHPCPLIVLAEVDVAGLHFPLLMPQGHAEESEVQQQQKELRLPTLSVSRSESYKNDYNKIYFSQ